MPQIEGLTPDFDAVVSPAGGMPAQDLDITVVYRGPAPAAPVGDQEEPVAEEATTTQEEPAAEIITTVSEEPAAEIITTAQEETTIVQEVTSAPGRVEPEVIADEPETYRLGVIEVDANGDADLVEIDDYEVPLAAPSAGYWALLNFLLALCTVFGMILIAVICILGRKEKNNEDDAEKKSKGIRKWLVYLSPIPAIAAVIIFLLTEDMTRFMAMTDKWTILMAVLFLIELAIMFFSRKKKQDEEEEF